MSGVTAVISKLDASLQVELGVRYVTGEVDSGDTADADIRSFTLEGAAVTISGDEQNMVSIGAGRLTTDSGDLITIAASEDLGPQVGRWAVVIFPDIAEDERQQWPARTAG